VGIVFPPPFAASGGRARPRNTWILPAPARRPRDSNGGADR
jgi:hypothetical protein